MQEKQIDPQAKRPDPPEEAGINSGVDDPSLEEEESVEEESATPHEEEEQSADEDEEEVVVEEDEFLEEEPPPKRGCLTGCIIPLAVLFLIIAVAFTIAYSKRNTIHNWLLKGTVSNTQNHVLNEVRLAIEEGRTNDIPDMNEAQIEKEFDKVKLALKEGRIDEVALMEAIKQYQDTIEERKRLAINNLMSAFSALLTQDAR